MRVHGDLDELVPAPMIGRDREAALAADPPEIPKMFVDVVAALVVKLVEAGTAEELDGDGNGAVDDFDEHEDRSERVDRPTGRSGPLRSPAPRDADDEADAATSRRR